MADIGEIQGRLENLGVIEHLVRSMRAMSAIRWRKARNSLEAVQRYAAQVQQQLSVAASYPTALVQSTGSSPAGESNHVGLIVIASDHGLCGPFNTVLFSTADVHIERWRAQGKSISIIALGEYARRRYCDQEDRCQLIWTHRFPLTHVVSFVETRDIWRKVEELYQQTNLDQLYVIYNYFISFGSYRQRLVRLLPPELKTQPDDAPLPLLGSDAAKLQQYLLFEHLALQLYLGMVESMVSEQGARLQAMDAAKANIEERSQELRRAYHIARQANITEEMLEISSGSAALPQ
ncbi:MAG: F0F1 ATP synthase subunit gamma [Anaerolineae bacterium]|nr:F0F1 ATP synthase subunit gamma [Anaerolineae bacterium]